MATRTCTGCGETCGDDLTVCPACGVALVEAEDAIWADDEAGEKDDRREADREYARAAKVLHSLARLLTLAFVAGAINLSLHIALTAMLGAKDDAFVWTLIAIGVAQLVLVIACRSLTRAPRTWALAAAIAQSAMVLFFDRGVLAVVVLVLILVCLPDATRLQRLLRRYPELGDADYRRRGLGRSVVARFERKERGGARRILIVVGVVVVLGAAFGWAAHLLSRGRSFGDRQESFEAAWNGRGLERLEDLIGPERREDAAKRLEIALERRGWTERRPEATAAKVEGSSTERRLRYRLEDGSELVVVWDLGRDGSWWIESFRPSPIRPLKNLDEGTAAFIAGWNAGDAGAIADLFVDPARRDRFAATIAGYMKKRQKGLAPEAIVGRQSRGLGDGEVRVVFVGDSFTLGSTWEWRATDWRLCTIGRPKATVGR